MAGDRGFLFPELTASATNAEATEVKQQKYDGYYSSTKTCEIAMSEAVKENYESILYLVDEAPRPPRIFTRLHYSCFHTTLTLVFYSLYTVKDVDERRMDVR